MSLPALQPLPVILTTEQVAEVLQCDAKTVDGYVENHDLKIIQIGRDRRIRGADLLDFIAGKPLSTKGARKKKQ